MSRLRPSLPWFRLVPIPTNTTTLVDCGATTAMIADSAITTVKLNDCGVTSAKIADSAVGNAEIADCSIGSSKIQDSGVATGDIADCAVTSAKIADSNVGADEIADSAVMTAKIRDNAVTDSKMYDTSLPVRIIQIHASDTLLVVGDTLATFFVPAELNGYDLIRAEAAVKIADTTSRVTVQIRDVTGAADMLVNKITIDTGEKTSYTSDTASSIDTTNDTLATGQEIAIDIDSATSAEDLYVILSMRKP